MDLWDSPLTQSAAALCVFKNRHQKTGLLSSFLFYVIPVFFPYHHQAERSHVVFKHVLCSWWHTVKPPALCRREKRLALRDRQAGKLHLTVFLWILSHTFFNDVRSTALWLLFCCCVQKKNSSDWECTHTLAKCAAELVHHRAEIGAFLRAASLRSWTESLIFRDPCVMHQQQQQNRSSFFLKFIIIIIIIICL